ncbi:MAG: tol-pal system protein YbgF, partial [Alphaproteobacteria bacterium]
RPRRSRMGEEPSRCSCSPLVGQPPNKSSAYGRCFWFWQRPLTIWDTPLHWRKRNPKKRTPMQRLTFAFLIVTSSLALAGTSWGQAVAVDATSLMKRLDAMEAKMNARGGASSGTPNIGGAYSTNDIQSRLDDLESDSSQLRGNTDRATQAIELLAKRFDDFAKDMDMRMGDMEARIEQVAKAPATAAAAEEPAAAAAEPAAVEPAAEKPKAAATSATGAAIPADMSASDQYNKAYAYLTATDYKNAQVWFEEFLKRHPKDALADNAYYWLGEVYLVQNNPNAAVAKFRDGLKAFPKGAKASANLYKMGVALEQLKQPKLAKAAWGKLVRDFPNAPETSKAKDKMALIKE